MYFDDHASPAPPLCTCAHAGGAAQSHVEGDDGGPTVVAVLAVDAGTVPEAREVLPVTAARIAP